ncbi:short-chain dehydrogenase/reductase family 42E member 1 [Patella vulgata]|uniref:short-chain dehydrogenase/reductase family 42E member 1 n=1 Tax=Patella vulgata TaxID=6465 RepID=UPI0024A7BBB7|nr:short-chain dehydrogenase/reductase family 42E member 1 [Patella vulgata]XP_050392993.2 short-chain dehydrogenase/reductase family 42E member 1 [Patella vulgata]
MATDSKYKELHVITGGGGYPGFCLGKELIKRGHRVRLIDIREPIWDLLDGMEFVKGDIRQMTDINTAFLGADIVYHLASFGMSGRDQLNKKLIEEINIGGTTNVIEGCYDNNIERLVFTSTYNVVYGGTEIINGDESLPYLQDDKFTDHYSKTKRLAEEKIMSVNDTETKDGKKLYCCALRLAGVYGPGEQRHIPRIVSLLEQGVVKFIYGAADSRVDFLHVDNLAQCHALAGEALTKSKHYKAAGQVYFVSDGKPINNFEFFRPLFEGLGYSYPSIRLPFVLIFYCAFVIEIIHSVVGKIYNFQPLLTRTEVYKTGVTHYFSIKKAQDELGYSPTKQNDLSEVVQLYRQMGRVKSNRKSYFSVSGLILNVVLFIVIFSMIMSYLPYVK